METQYYRKRSQDMLQNPERRGTIQTQRDPSSAIDMMFSQDEIASPAKGNVSSLQSKLTGGRHTIFYYLFSIHSTPCIALQSGSNSL